MVAWMPGGFSYTAALVLDRCMSEPYMSSVQILTLHIVSTSPFTPPKDPRLPIRFTNRGQGVDRWRVSVRHNRSAYLAVLFHITPGGA